MGKLSFRMLMIVATTALICGSARADIVSFTSNVPITQITPPAGSTVGSNFLITLGLTPADAFNEQQNVLLGSSLTTDTGVISAGTLVSSYFVAFNDSNATPQSTTVTFSTPVLGIVFEDGSSYWAASDFLGLPSLIYQEDPNFCPNCGYETGETATFAGDQAFLNSNFSVPGDFARIITEGSTATPEPSSFVLFGTAGLMLALKLIRRSPVGAAR